MTISINTKPFMEGIRTARAVLDKLAHRRFFLRVSHLETYHIASRWILKWRGEVKAYMIHGKLFVAGRRIF